MNTAASPEMPPNLDYRHPEFTGGWVSIFWKGSWDDLAEELASDWADDESDDREARTIADDIEIRTI
ncbi:hypothetical protein SAMN02744133_108192 [Thalassospira xiamenensis M-5 = DSM 17429]|uniref:hypothetical protein n=1 Tax=Thalassospira xiamenensis TaxID=220697 RepID=UPI00095682B8|nr:hypothetical protein [Thalassospira xiamenensis]SIT22367.1 hypothetical protein SAMN02744133_108192 [Thalassospira xiamenensis M-5 = DSM 17429]